MSHQTISFVKSGIRILGYISFGAIMFVPVTHMEPLWYASAGFLVASELIGIYEEVGER